MAAKGSEPAGVAPGSALGLVETLGLVASIEAADAMLKASDVRLVRKHRVDPGRITHIVVGETSAVQAAVDAGVAAAQRVGQVYGSLVIPRPSDDVWRAMLGVPLAGDEAPATSASRASAEAPADEAAGEPAPGEPAPGEPAPEDGPADGPPSGPVPPTAPPERDYDAMTVRTLRSLVRDRGDAEIAGRAVASAAKDDLVAALRAADAQAAGAP